MQREKFYPLVLQLKKEEIFNYITYYTAIPH